MVGTIRLLRLALLTKPDVTGRGLHSERCVLHPPAFGRGQMTISIVEIERRAGIGEYGGRIAPVEHEVEEYTEEGGELPYGLALASPSEPSEAPLHPGTALLLATVA